LSIPTTPVAATAPTFRYASVGVAASADLATALVEGDTTVDGMVFASQTDPFFGTLSLVAVRFRPSGPIHYRVVHVFATGSVEVYYLDSLREAGAVFAELAWAYTFWPEAE
jgi:hypothetical protein